ncbi:hypothetical protein TNCV_2063721 [Trichonephila clavipes]|nr:hypothetical protein TNCV_2063721 [Trichonephila clavipes]
MSAVHHAICGSNASDFLSRINGFLEDIHVLQAASNGTSGHQMMRNILNLLCYGSGCGCANHHCHSHNHTVINESGATRWVWFAPSIRRFLLKPAWFRPTL